MGGDEQCPTVKCEIRGSCQSGWEKRGRVFEGRRNRLGRVVEGQGWYFEGDHPE